MTSVDEVVLELGDLIEQARRSDSALGYFPALYRKVTLRVQQGIAAGEFDDAERMQRLVVTFADRYLDARRGLKTGARPTKAWRVCFQAADDSSSIVLQHLLLGMNAHINLDLGIAAATVSEGSELAALRGDFNRINDVLQSLVADVNADLTQVWPPLRFLNVIGRRSGDHVTDFSMRRARDHAWALAEDLAKLKRAQWSARIEAADRTAVVLAELVTRPPLITRPLFWVIRLGERGSVSERIDLLVD